MTDRAELIEKMAAAIQIAQAGSSFGDTLRNIASDLADLALEEAARVASDMWIEGHGNLPVEPYAAAKQVCSEIAAAIRALKSRA